MFLKKIVIGSSIESLLYAFINGSHHINNGPSSPFFFERLETPIMGTNSKKELWTKVQLMNSFLGKSLTFEGLRSIRFKDNLIKINHSKGSEDVHFENCLVFQNEKLFLENEVLTSKPDVYRVIDDLEIRNMSKNVHLPESANSVLGWVNSILFYTSGRVLGAKYVTDCVTESLLEKDQLHNIEFSDLAVKFCLQKYLASLGIRGKKSGTSPSGKPKFKKPEVTHVKRIVMPVSRTKYKDSETVKFRQPCLRQIIDG